MTKNNFQHTNNIKSNNTKAKYFSVGWPTRVSCCAHFIFPSCIFFFNFCSIKIFSFFHLRSPTPLSWPLDYTLIVTMFCLWVPLCSCCEILSSVRSWICWGNSGLWQELLAYRTALHPELFSLSMNSLEKTFSSPFLFFLPWLQTILYPKTWNSLSTSIKTTLKLQIAD